MALRAIAFPSSAGESPSAEISIADAKAHFSEVVAGVEQRRQAFTVVRRGKPVARIVPVDLPAPTLYGSMRGTVTELGDIVGPTGAEWTVEGE